VRVRTSNNYLRRKVESNLRFSHSSDALQEIESFFKRSHEVIVALTVREILDEHIAKKLL